MRDLADIRRKRVIDECFSFVRIEIAVDPEFKSLMTPDGAFFEVEETLSEFPAIAAGLLKYKKHEWIILRFERDQAVHKMWLNKGLDNSMVASFLGFAEVTRLATSLGCTSVLVFHDHPNPGPSKYAVSQPSKQDRRSAVKSERKLVTLGVSLLEFVCERGLHHEFYRGAADEFMPVHDFQSAVRAENAVTHMGNFRLHQEHLAGRRCMRHDDSPISSRMSSVVNRILAQ